MLLLGIDFETTGLDTQLDVITEVAAVLWDTETKTPIEMYSAFTLGPDGRAPSINPELVLLNGIFSELIEAHGELLHNVSARLQKMHAKALYLCAHNAPFDKAFFERTFYKTDAPWIDTRTDLPFPKKIKARSLTHLAAEHGFVNPFPHRALFDVLTMFKILSMYPMEDVLKYYSSPTITIQAMVKYDDREKARSRGYHWQSEVKAWRKQIKAFQLDQEKAQSDFPVQLITG